ncbi:hypothetical protein [Actinophytocola sediminis]
MSEQGPVRVDESGLDERGVLHAPGVLPAEDPAAKQDWDGLRPALRERLAGVLGTRQMWWRDHDDPNRTSVLAFGDRAMCVATPVSVDGQARHRVELRRWVPGSLTQQRFRTPGADTSARRLAEHDPATLDSMPPEVSALLGHLPSAVQWYLQVPLLTAGENNTENTDGAVGGSRWYHVWDQPDRRMDIWIWLHSGRKVTFAHGRRVFPTNGRTSVPQWDLRCWRATCE